MYVLDMLVFPVQPKSVPVMTWRQVLIQQFLKKIGQWPVGGPLANLLEQLVSANTMNISEG